MLSRRNELVALDLFVTAVMAMFAFVSMIGGIFGMNMKNGYEESKVGHPINSDIDISPAMCCACRRVLTCDLMWVCISPCTFDNKVLCSMGMKYASSHLLLHLSCSELSAWVPHFLPHVLLHLIRSMKIQSSSNVYLL